MRWGEVMCGEGGEWTEVMFCKFSPSVNPDLVYISQSGCKGSKVGIIRIYYLCKQRLC